MMGHGQRGKRGFSLVEVSLAVLVVGLGILSIFGLFPTGLAASVDAAADTDTGLFANWAMTWIKAQADDAKVQVGPDPAAAQTAIRTAWKNWLEHAFLLEEFKPGIVHHREGDVVAYWLEIENVGGNNRVKGMTLYVLPWKGATPPTSAIVQDKGQRFYQELYFTVLP